MAADAEREPLSAADAAVFGADEDVGRDLAAVDWSATPMGPPATWPQSLRTAVSILLSSRFSMWMAWGPQLTFFCNDAYRRDTLGQKYPWALGRPAGEVWAEIWPDIGPRIDRVLVTGQATWDERLAPSSDHGVTTVVAGNCGVGFAPAAPDRHNWLIGLMEGVEDIPGVVMVDDSVVAAAVSPFTTGSACATANPGNAATLWIGSLRTGGSGPVSAVTGAIGASATTTAAWAATTVAWTSGAATAGTDGAAAGVSATFSDSLTAELWVVATTADGWPAGALGAGVPDVTTTPVRPLPNLGASCWPADGVMPMALSVPVPTAVAVVVSPPKALRRSPIDGSPGCEVPELSPLVSAEIPGDRGIS